MKIAYSGFLLHHALASLGHEIFLLPGLCGGSPANACEPFVPVLQNICPQPDLVFLEMWQEKKLPPDMHSIPFPTAAWFIDSPINSFWQMPMSVLFDHVFVDQKNCADKYAHAGYAANWLPLCAPNGLFTPVDNPRQHGLSFVGRLSAARQKRNNLVAFLRERYPLHLVTAGANIREEFGLSYSTINENLFDGVNLRVFQATAAGALLLTEKNSPGLEDCFTPDEDLILYEPHTLAPLLDSLFQCLATPNATLANGKSLAHYQNIARSGQKTCRERHSATVRAKQMLDVLACHPSQKREKLECLAGLAQAEYALRQKYGGMLDTARKAMNEALHLHTDMEPAASEPQPARKSPVATVEQNLLYSLGIMEARKSNYAKALQYFSDAGYLPMPAVMTALVFLYQGDVAAALTTLVPFLAEGEQELALAGPAQLGYTRTPCDLAVQKSFVLYFAAQVLLKENRIIDLGFTKASDDLFPETALAMLQLAWKTWPEPFLLDAILDCAHSAGKAGELLHLLLTVIERNQATDLQMIRAAELAEGYYNKPVAIQIIRALQQARIVSKLHGWADGK